MNKRVLLAVKLAVSAGLVWFLYRRAPVADLGQALAGVRLWPLPLIAALLLANTLLSAYKWQILLRANAVRVPLTKLFNSYLIGTFFNIFLPSSIGGDAYRVYDITRRGSSTANSFASVLADRLSGFLALATVATLASVWVGHMTANTALVGLPLAALAGLALVVALLYWQTPVRQLLFATRLNRVRPLAGFISRCLDAFSQYRAHPGLLPRVMAISFIFQTSLVACVYLMARALDIRIAFVYFCAFVPMICLLEAIPISIYGIGIRDAGYVFFFGLVGLGQVQTRSLALLFLGVNIAYALLGGVLFAFRVFGPESPRGMAKPLRLGGGRTFATALLATLAIWTLFAWPLPRDLTRGIPCSSRNVEKGHVRRMIAGDHLQLLYHFWLADDMMRGNTPLFANLYEFNTGDDAARREPGSYYAPFSLVYALGSACAGAAFGWNLTGFLALFATFLLTWRLLRRYADDDWIAAPAAALALLLPYRWIMLLGGSPTGFAMALPPLLLLGLDTAVRDDRAAGGFAAGAALLLAFCSDLHTFFFCALATPCWCLVAFLARPAFAWRDRRAYGRLALALLPCAALGLVAFLLSRLIAAELDSATLAGGWSLREVAPYSPLRAGLFSHANRGVSNQVFIGRIMPALLALGLLLRIAAWARTPAMTPPPARRLLTLLLVLTGMAGLIALALGTHGPLSGAPLNAVRKLVPPYRMIRQTAKIFCFLPTLLALAAAIGFADSRRFGRRLPRALLLAGLLLVLIEYRLQISPTICLLDRRQDAYAAIAAEADAHATPPRALALPLWPGDSHWSSLYQHYASLYRLRMVNGYRPAVPREYVETVFRRYESANQGLLSDAQLDDMRARHIHYLLLHEDAFPEQVSPFPVNATLQRLIDHPRLSLLKQDGRVWAFRILSTPEARPEKAPANPYRFPALRWECERTTASDVSVLAEPSASSGRCLRLDRGISLVTLSTRAPIANTPALRVLLRARGHGMLLAETEFNALPGTALEVAIDRDNWGWYEVPIDTELEFPSFDLSFLRTAGAVDLDMALLAAGPWPELKPGDAVELPASAFFHAGYSTTPSGAVRLERERDPDRAILYGPHLPLLPGVYTVELHVTPDLAATPAPLGELVLKSGDVQAGRAVVTSDRGALVSFREKDGLPLRIEFVYNRERDVEIIGCVIRRIE